MCGAGTDRRTGCLHANMQTAKIWLQADYNASVSSRLQPDMSDNQCASTQQPSAPLFKQLTGVHVVQHFKGRPHHSSNTQRVTSSALRSS